MPKEPSYIHTQEEQQVMFNAANKAFQFSNYKRFKEISDIKKFFVIQKELGKGAFGEVSLATHKNMQM